MKTLVHPFIGQNLMDVFIFLINNINDKLYNIII